MAAAADVRGSLSRRLYILLFAELSSPDTFAKSGRV